jgi:WD40 repeat protein
MWVQKVPSVIHLAYSLDGRTLYSIERNGTLTAWDITTRAGHRLKGPFLWSIGDVRGIYPLADHQRIVWLDKFATVLDANTGRELGGVRNLTEHKSGLRRVTPEGRLFYLKTGGFGVAMWNLTTRTSEPQRDIPKSARRLRTFDMSPDEQLVALVGAKGAVTVYEWGTGTELQNPVALDGTTDTVRFSPDSRTLALFSGRQVQMWDMERGTLWGAPVNIDTRHGEATFAFHPTAPVFIAPNRDKHLTFFGTETGAAIRSLDFALGGSVTCLAFSPDGLTCAVGGSNKQFAVFDVDL